MTSDGEGSAHRGSILSRAPSTEVGSIRITGARFCSATALGPATRASHDAALVALTVQRAPGPGDVPSEVDFDVLAEGEVVGRLRTDNNARVKPARPPQGMSKPLWARRTREALAVRNGQGLSVEARRNKSLRRLLSASRVNRRSSGMSRARILALSFVAALALSSGALAQGGGGGGGAGGGGAGGGASSGAGGASSGGANSGVGGTSGTNAAQSTRGQSSPSGNTAAQPPGSTGQNSVNSPGSGVGPGSTGAGISGPGGSGGPAGQR